MNQYLITIDIGGTKVAGGLIDTHNLSLVYIYEQKAIKGKPGLVQTMTAVISHLKQVAIKKNYQLSTTINIGMAGNINPQNPLVLPGTAVNLGVSPTEFDNLNIKQFFNQNLGEQWQFNVCNDGFSQLAGGFFQCVSNKQPLKNKKVAYIGPGTGLGGAFARFNGKTLEFYTDGHIYDMVLKSITGQCVFAEGLFSGTGFFNQYNISLKDVNSNLELLKTYEQEINHLGEYLYQICRNIYLGSFKKTSNYQWTSYDYQAVQGTRIFFMGGSVGTRGKIADRLIDRAKKMLEKEFDLEFTFYKIANAQAAALLGAAIFFDNK